MWDIFSREYLVDHQPSTRASRSTRYATVHCGRQGRDRRRRPPWTAQPATLTGVGNGPIDAFAHALADVGHRRPGARLRRARAVRRRRRPGGRLRRGARSTARSSGASASTRTSSPPRCAPSPRAVNRAPLTDSIARRPDRAIVASALIAGSTQIAADQAGGCGSGRAGRGRSSSATGKWQATRCAAPTGPGQRRAAALRRADLLRLPAAGAEAAAGRRVDRARHVAGEQDPLALRLVPPVRVGHRHGREQRDRVRVHAGAA